MTRAASIVLFLMWLALIALVWACTYLAVPFFVADISRLIIASVVASVVWRIGRDSREFD